MFGNDSWNTNHFCNKAKHLNLNQNSSLSLNLDLRSEHLSFVTWFW